MVVGNSVIVGPSKGWISLVSTAFWGPVIQAIALILLVICGFQARSSPSGASSSSKLPNIAVPMYQTGYALTVFNGLVFIVDGAVSREHWTDILIGTFQVLIFLVDTFALGSMVRFRFGYIWIPVVLFALSMIPVIILVATSAKSSGGLVGVTIGLAAGFVVLILISSLVLTALTRVVPKCCLSGRQLRDETVADDIEEQRDATSA